MKPKPERRIAVKDFKTNIRASLVLPTVRLAAKNDQAKLTRLTRNVWVNPFKVSPPWL